MSTKGEVIKEEINLQFHWYILSFFILYYGSFIIPLLIFMSYIMLIYLPLVLETGNFILLFTTIESLVATIILPVLIIACYLLHLFFIALILRGIWWYTEKKSPTVDGIIPRNIPSKVLNFYHIRSFAVKYPRNSFLRGMFPWLITWLYNFARTGKFGKGSVIEEQVSGDRSLNVGENVYIGVGGGAPAHAVEGIFGNITYAEIKIEDNSTTAGFNCIGPGAVFKKNSWLFPTTGATKHNTLKGNNYYFGAPLRKITKKRVMEYLQITEEEYDKGFNLTVPPKKENKKEIA